MGYVPGQDDVRLADEAAVREGVATAAAAVHLAQRESAAFMAAYGGTVLGGHSPVNAPGRQGDPDTPMPDAADPA